ncbi:MAG TPA: glycosyltransferase [Candidatus Wunengus sp. YC60]|uniref:glycosyltransferase n=1 Tax=Candidatus Wunengus sp. YC60 TaxID=3367697 RepID=UPI00402929A5
MQLKQLKYQVVILFTLCVYLYYLVYRLRYTINPDALILSISFFYADVHGFISLSLFAFQLWNQAERKPVIPLPGLSVDIYIPTYNEDISVIRKTALGCINIMYPHKTYILDDGNRTEVAKKASEWGCGYIARTERLHAKAGNLNHALQQTNGEFVAIFDTDCVPQPDFLDKTLGYFQDEKTAFVQTPHNYYNIDSFQFRVNMEKEKFWIEQNLFYRLIMPGRDYWNSSFFAGTAAVLRKKALESIGGFATESITEDLHTTIRLYSRGSKGIYHNEVLSNELAAKDIKNYKTQLLRWAEGNLSMFFKCNPLFTKGLTVPQRVCFFSTIFGWLFGFPKLIYLTLPTIGIFFEINPIRSFDFSFIWRCSFFLVVLIFGFEFVTRGYGKIMYCECFNTMNFLIVIKAAFRNVFRLKSIFKVTGKGMHETFSIFDLTPQLLICLFSFAGTVWGGLKLYYGVHSSSFTGISAAIFWNFANGLLAWSVIGQATRPLYKRKEFRFIGAVPVQYSIDEDVLSAINWGVARDINESGISLSVFTPLSSGKIISLSLYLDKVIIHCKARVVFCTPHTNYPRGKMFICGTKFEELNKEELDMITRYCFNTVLPRFRYRFAGKPVFLSKILFKLYNQERFRKHIRRKMTLPLVIQNNGKASVTAVTNDISAAGLSFTSYAPVEPGGVLTMNVFTPFGILAAKGEIKQMREIVVGHSYFIGVKFIKLYNHAENIILNLTGEEHKKA